MIRKNLYSIICAILVWLMGVSFYLLSFFVPVLEDVELQSNLVLVLAVIPSSYLGTWLFYKKEFIKPSTLGLRFVLIAAFLDALITVPVFIIPEGGSHASFFSDPMFYTIAVELYFLVMYFGKHLTKTAKA